MGIKGLKAMNELIMLKRNGAGNRTLSISATFSLAKITKFCVQAQNISTLIQQNLQSQLEFFLISYKSVWDTYFIAYMESYYSAVT